MNKTIIVRNLGKMSYLNALKVQEELWATRSSNFKDTLLIVEHVPQVYLFIQFQFQFQFNNINNIQLYV